MIHIFLLEMYGKISERFYISWKNFHEMFLFVHISRAKLDQFDHRLWWLIAEVSSVNCFNHSHMLFHVFFWVDHRLRWRHSAWVVWCKACKDSIMLEVVLVGGFGWFIVFSMLCLHPKQSPHCLYTSITKRCFIWELYYIVINLLHEPFTNMCKFTSIITYKKPHLHVSNGLPSDKTSHRPRVTPMSWRCKASAIWQRCR